MSRRLAHRRQKGVMELACKCAHLQTQWEKIASFDGIFVKPVFTQFLTAILHRGLRNDFFSQPFTQFLFGVLFPFFVWTFIFLFSLGFYFHFLFRLIFPFSLWTFISLFSLDFYSIAVTFWISSNFLFFGGYLILFLMLGLVVYKYLEIYA